MGSFGDEVSVSSDQCADKTATWAKSKKKNASETLNGEEQWVKKKLTWLEYKKKEYAIISAKTWANFGD